MKTKFFTLVLSALFLMPCALRAEEVVIQLMEVVTMSPIPGDDPLDGPEQSGNNPTRPNDFRATVDGHFLRVTKQNANISRRDHFQQRRVCTAYRNRRRCHRRTIYCTIILVST